MRGVASRLWWLGGLNVVLLVAGSILGMSAHARAVGVAVGPLLLLGLGQSLTLVGAGIDLSIPGALALAELTGNEVVGLFPPEGLWWLLAFAVTVVAMLGVGALVGLGNGLLVARGPCSPIAVTLGMALIGLGLARWGGSGRGWTIPDSYQEITAGDWVFVPNGIWAGVAALVLAWAVLRWRREGRQLVALGEDADAAIASGVPAGTIRVEMFVGSSVLATAAAVVLLGYGEIAVGAAPAAWLLDSVLIAALAGARPGGGGLPIFGLALAALLVAQLQSVMVLARIEVATGLALRAALLGLIATGPRGLLR